jgi:membrane protease YdiL (CAAX protease family)
MADAAARPALRRPVAEAGAVSAGLVLFALTAHSGLPWVLAGAAGLAAAAIAIGLSLRATLSRSACLVLVHETFSRRACAALAIGLIFGGGLGVTYRVVWGLNPLPAGIEAFVLVACLVGATEELVYRGYVQGRLRVLGWPAAVVLAAVAHTAYKTALFVLPASPVDVNFVFLATWTLAGGIVFGLLREFSRSILPPVAAHAAFDLVVYGALAQAPWWVWA